MFRRDQVSRRDAAPLAKDPSFWGAVSRPRGLPEPGGPGWATARDRDIIVAGLDVVARANLVSAAASAVERELVAHQPDRLEDLRRLWGTLVSTELARQLTKGGKRTWGPRGSQPGLLHLVRDLDRPSLLDGREPTLAAVRSARRGAIEGLWDFRVELSPETLFGVEREALRRSAYPALTKEGPIAAPELHKRATQVFVFYGVASPGQRNRGKRGWQFYLWRLARVQFQLDRYQDVRLASLPWVGPEHFARWIRDR